MIRVPTHREPTHPGEMLLEEFLSLWILPRGSYQKRFMFHTRGYTKTDVVFSKTTSWLQLYSGKIVFSFSPKTIL